MFHCVSHSTEISPRSNQERWKGSLQDWLRTVDLPAKSAVNVEAVLQTFYEIVESWSHLERLVDRTRILASTAAGHIGWVPEATVPGDEIVLFKGSPFP